MLHHTKDQTINTANKTRHAKSAGQISVTRIVVIGAGAICRYVVQHAQMHGYEIVALLVRAESVEKTKQQFSNLLCISTVKDIPSSTDYVIDCAGHSALGAYGADVLRQGFDLITVSLGALADAELLKNLKRAATENGTQLLLASGAIGALDCLRSARVGKLHSVQYIGRKPPKSWMGSPAETKIDLNNLSTHAETHFDGTARDAAKEYPKNANVAAAVALAGIGFDATNVQLIADPNVTENIHEIEASGEFGRFKFEVRGRSLADNPRSSALAAMSVVSLLEQQSEPIVF